MFCKGVATPVGVSVTPVATSGIAGSTDAQSISGISGVASGVDTSAAGKFFFSTITRSL